MLCTRPSSVTRLQHVPCVAALATLKPQAGIGGPAAGLGIAVQQPVSALCILLVMFSSDVLRS